MMMILKTTTIDLLPSSDLLSPLSLVKTIRMEFWFIHHSSAFLEMGSYGDTFFFPVVFLR